jgi:Na+-translocating ferredoxin:NAD+ oxidoreductase RnfC subunit
LTLRLHRADRRVNTLVIHAYDWSLLTYDKHLMRAHATTADKLQASLDRFAALAEHD